MKKHTVKLRQRNMLCHRCVFNVVKALSQIKDIQQFNVSLETEIIKIIYKGEKLSREMIVEIVNEAITKGKVTSFALA
jgi:copper chaperone CopZ